MIKNATPRQWYFLGGLIVVLIGTLLFNRWQDKQMHAFPEVEIPVDAERAIFAGGCFRCIEPAFQEEPGVIDVIVGYAGGELAQPTYEQVVSGETTHREAALVMYDPDDISYERLLEIYWSVIDPTDPEGQFVDKGFQYTTAIFVKDKAQQIKAEASLIAQSLSEKYDQSIVTKILPFTTFFPAEEYHQDYYIKAPQRYERYKDNSGRKEFFDQQTPEE